MKTLHLIVSLFNPSGYQSRYTRYHQFAEYVSKFKNVQLWTVEGVHPGQDFQVTRENDPFHLRVRLSEWIWHKEALLNVLIKKLPDDGNPIAWVDADIIFARPDWVEATLEKLEEVDVVQMFSQCQELTDEYNLLPGNLRRGMIAAYKAGMHMHTDGPCAYPRPGPITTVLGHCGYAWAMTREALRKMGGKLLDHAIVGSGDYQMATAWCGDVSAAIPSGISEGYLKAIQDYAQLVKDEGITVGFVPGIALHLWHGKRKDRGFEWRDRILVQHQYNPATDIAYDETGLIHLVEDGSGRVQSMHEAIKGYFNSRNEDITYNNGK